VGETREELLDRRANLLRCVLEQFPDLTIEEAVEYLNEAGW